jgi:hypothetical protein
MTSRIRDTEIPDNPEISVGRLLDSRDIDQLASMLHALLEEVAGLSVKLARLEAKIEGHPDKALQELQEVQAHVAELVARVTD